MLRIAGFILRRTQVTSFATLLLLVASCHDITDQNSVGSLRVIVRTTGASLDANGYAVSVNGGSDMPVSINDTVTIPVLFSGIHTVTLNGLAENCAAVGSRVRQVAVRSAQTSEVLFVAICDGIGTLEVTVSTTGVDHDPDGYTISIGPGITAKDVNNNATVSFPGLRARLYTVALTGVSANCEVASFSERSVSIVADGSSAISFSVLCEPAKQLAYVWGYGPSDIYLIKSNGAGVTRLTYDPAADYDPAWSPDGQRIAFTSNRGGVPHIHVINADRSGIQQLTNGSTDFDPAWSPDGSRIAFVSLRDGNSELYVMNADGTNVRRLTDHPATDADPDWSPDGTKLVFSSNRDENGDLYVMPADGSSVARITRFGSIAKGESATQPAWSPDGTRIAFTRVTCPSLTTCYAIVNVTLADGRALEAVSLNGRQPSWSRDGRDIAYAAINCWSSYYDYAWSCAPAGTWVFRASSGSPKQLTSAIDTSQPVWQR